MKTKEKIKFPLSIDTEIEFPDLEFSENFQVKDVREKIDSRVREISSKKDKKTRSKKLF
jgi:hypothetical protein